MLALQEDKKYNYKGSFGFLVQSNESLLQVVQSAGSTYRLTG